MANITNYLNKIKTAVYGKDVRGAIHDAIKQVYDDASVNHDNANMEVKMARGTHNTLNDRLDKSDEIQAQTNAQLSQINDEISDLNDSLIQKTNRITLFEHNVDFNSNYFRIPFMTVTGHGTIIAGSDIRYKSSSDTGFIELGVKRSTDGGKTWSSGIVAMSNNNVDSEHSRCMDGTILYDHINDRIYLLGNFWDTGNELWVYSQTQSDPNWDVKLCYSDNDGLSWSNPISLRNLCPSGYSAFIGGVGSGLCMENGTLVFPIQLNPLDKPSDSNFTKSGIIYSKDGVNWSMSTSFVDGPASESNVVEIETGKLLINCRSDGNKFRKLLTTENLGDSWVNHDLSLTTTQPNACMGSMIKIPLTENGAILFSSPASTTRKTLTVSVMSADERTFNGVNVIYPWDYDGYSCLGYDKNDNRLYIVFEVGGNICFEDITYVLNDLKKARGIRCYDKDVDKISSSATFYVSHTRSSDNNSGLTRNTALRTFDKLPQLINGKYKSVNLFISSEYPDNIELSQIDAKVTVHRINDSTGATTIKAKKIYIRGCKSVTFNTNIDIAEPFSNNYAIAIEDSVVRFSNIVSLEEVSKASHIFYIDNSRLVAKDVRVATNVSAGIDSCVYSKSTGGNVWVQFNELPYAIHPCVGEQGNIVVTYRESGAGIKLNTGGKVVVGSTIGQDARITYNQYVNGVVLSNKIEHLDTPSVNNMIRDSKVEGDWGIKVRDTSELSKGEVIFTLPPALRPRMRQRLVLCGVKDDETTMIFDCWLGIDGILTTSLNLPNVRYIYGKINYHL